MFSQAWKEEWQSGWLCRGLCETQYFAAVFIVNISIFFFQTSYPLPNTAVHLVYSMCEFFFLYYFYCLLSLSFFQFYQYFLVFFRYFIFLFFTCSSPMASHCMCRVVAWRQCGAPRPCHSAVDCLPLVHSLSLSPSHSLCVDCINLAHVVIAAIDA